MENSSDLGGKSSNDIWGAAFSERSGNHSPVFSFPRWSAGHFTLSKSSISGHWTPAPENMIFLLYLQPRNIKFQGMKCLHWTPSSNFRGVFLHWHVVKDVPIFNVRVTTRGKEVWAEKKGLHTPALQTMQSAFQALPRVPACQGKVRVLSIWECPKSVLMLTFGCFPEKKMVRKK